MGDRRRPWSDMRAARRIRRQRPGLRHSPLALVVAILVVLLPACTPGEQTAEDPGPGEGDAGDGGEPIALRMTWWGSDLRHGMTQEALDLFEQKNPGITVNGEFLGWDGYWDQLNTRFAGGNPQDVIQMSERFLSEYAQRGVLLDLNPYVPDVLRTEELNEEVLAGGTIGDALYAVPWAINVRTMVYNPEILERAGVALPDDAQAWTWEEFGRVAAQVSANTEEGVYGASNPGGAIENFEVFLHQRGGQLYAEDGSLAFSVADLVDWWAMTEQWRTSGATVPAEVTAIEGSGRLADSALVTDTAAMSFFWSNQLTAYSEAHPGELRLFRYPGEADQPGVSYHASMLISAAASTAHPEAAAKLIDFLVNDVDAARILVTERGAPVNETMRSVLADQISPVELEVLDYLAELEGEVHDTPRPVPVGGGEVAEQFTRSHEQVIFEQLSVEQAAEQFVREAQEMLG